MTPEELPDDLAAWPGDDLEILGLAPDSPVRAIKAAYAVRIKRFKPERHPEHFKRLREACERLIAAAEWRERRPDWNAPPQTAPMPVPADPPEPDLSGFFANLWNFALQGEAVTAYSMFKEVAKSVPGREATFVRLYWLLAGDPSLDPERVPFEWLVDGLAASPDSRRLFALACDEMLADPSLGESPAGARLLELDLPPDVLATFIERRWEAVAVHRRSAFAAAIRSDLERLNSRATTDGNSLAWRIWLASCEAGLLSVDPDGYELARAGFAAIDAQPIDRAAEHMAACGDRLRHSFEGDFQEDVDDEVLRDVLTLRFGSDALRRAMVADFAAAAAFHPEIAYLRIADAGESWSWFPGVLGDLLAEEPAAPLREPSEDLLKEAERRINLGGPGNYAFMRPRILAVALELGIPQAVFARHLAKGETRHRRIAADLARELDSDPSFRAVQLAHDRFWSEAVAAFETPD